MNVLSDNKRLQTTTVDYKRLINGLILAEFAILQRILKTHQTMTDKKPFDKEHPTKIPFSELVELIGTSCDYKFCIIDENIDDELFELAARHCIDLTGYKHVIETTGINIRKNGMVAKVKTGCRCHCKIICWYLISSRSATRWKCPLKEMSCTTIEY